MLAGGDGLADVAREGAARRVHFHVVPQRGLHREPFGANITGIRTLPAVGPAKDR